MSNEPKKCISTEPPLSKHIHYLGWKLGLPVSGTFELTSRCNFNCPMCYIHSAENSIDEISAAQWLQLAEDAKKEGLMYLLLTGGEPFIRRDFAEIYEGIIQKGIIVSINTNASLYNEELRELFRKYPPARLNISLYGGSNDCYGRMCGNPAFDKVFDNIKKMKEDGLNIRFNASLTPHNCGDMESISAISKELDIYCKGTTYMYPPVRISDSLGKNEGRFSAPEAGRQLARWYSIYETAEKFSARASLMNSDPPEEPDEAISRCRAGRCSFWVTANGRMLPCGTMNAESSDPFADGFSTAWQQVRARVAAIRMPEKCTTCPNRKFCGVCAAICVDETGSFSEVPEYACVFSENLKKEIIRIEKERNHADS